MATGIPGDVLEVRYRRGGRDAGRYVHRFGPNVRMRLGPGRSRLSMYHAKGEPIWADERGRDFDHWVDVDHKRRRGMNPRRRRRRSSRGGGPDWTMWALIGLGVYLFARPAGAVSTGGQPILAQPSSTLWFSDPYTGGGGEFFQGALPPGASPPWRIASQNEAAALQQGLLAGNLIQAGGGLFAPNVAFQT